MKINKLVYFNLLFLIFSMNLHSQIVPNNKYKVLYLNSYHKGYEWSDKITQGIEDAFNNESVDLVIEYLDTKRQFSDKYWDLLQEIILYKQGHNSFDLILTSDNNAFNLVKNNRSNFLPNIPIVFCGYNFLQKGVIQDSDITGINENIDIEGSIKLIKQIQPLTKKIVVITDNTTTGKIIQNRVNNLKNESGLLEIELIYDTTFKNLLKIVQNLDDKTVVLMTLFSIDTNGDYYETDIATQLITENSNVPVYGTWEFQMNNGIVGGSLLRGYDQGYNIGNIALMILNGESIENFPIIYDTEKRLIFDYSAMEKYNINANNLPQNSTVVNMPQSFFTRNREIIIFTVSVIVLLVFIIIIISRSLYRSVKAEGELSNYKERLEDIVEERTIKLNRSIKLLKKTQKQLVESEKIAALGSLVSGVAHEINTPIGIGVTATSHLVDITDKINQSMNDNRLTLSALQEYMENASESSRLIQRSLNKSAELVSKFKDISEKSDELESNFNIEELLTTLIHFDFPQLETGQFNLDITYSGIREIRSYSTAIKTITLNLIQNSIIHGFKGQDDGDIKISITIKNGTLNMLFRDNGLGIKKSDINSIFDPFYTTIRGKQTHGLGLHLVYKLITQTLKGRIKCKSLEGRGTIFKIEFPIIENPM